MQTISIKVTPRAKQNKIAGFKDDVLRVHVTAAPEHGKANQAVINILAKEFDIAKSDIRIVRGEYSRDKILEIPNGIAALQNRLI